MPTLASSPRDAATEPPPLSIFYHPQRPPDWAMIERLRRFAGIARAKRIEDAQWCMLFQNSTVIELPADDPYAEASWHWLNGRSRDIRKERIERVFAEIFGYELAVDPRRFTGAMLRKSDQNCVKDGTVLTGPVDEVLEGQVYERLVDTRTAPGQLTEVRLHVIGDHISAWVNTLEDWISEGRYRYELITSSLRPTDAVLSPVERAGVLQFCRTLGLDFAAVDALRDHHDGRLYLIDGNHTPSYDHWFTSRFPDDARRCFDEMTVAFWRAFPPRGL